MRIISKNHDYYDSAMGFGIDKTLVYIRKPEPMFPQNYRGRVPWSIPMHHSAGDHFTYRAFTIGFCGKVYMGVKIRHTPPSKHFLYPNEPINDVVYDYDSFMKIASQYGYKPERRLFIEGYNTLEEDFALFKGGIKKIKSFLEHNVPVIGPGTFEKWGKQREWLKNPELKPLKFMKVMDSYTAFQELSMFVGGVLRRPESPTVKISDACVRHQKGFDSWSFRKQPKNKPLKAPKITQEEMCVRG